MTIHPNIYRTLAPGPVVELRGYAAANRLGGKLYACLDYGGPTGTARDGLAEGMLALAAQRQVLAPARPSSRRPAAPLQRPWPWRGGPAATRSAWLCLTTPPSPPGAAVGAGGPAALLPCPGGVGGGPGPGRDLGRQAGLVLHRLAGL